MNFLSCLLGRSEPAPETPDVAPRPATDDEMREACLARGLTAEQVDLIVSLALPSARLLPDPAGESDAVGRSRLGGEPDLPVDADWPCDDTGNPLSFIAQIALDEVPPAVRADGDLPDGGLLSFFYDGAEQDSWGFLPEDRSRARVLHSAASQELVRRPFPGELSELGRFPAIALTLHEEKSYPDSGHPALVAAGVDRAADFAYLEIVEAGDTVHKLLGNPDEIQNGMRKTAELASTGSPAGDPSDYELPGVEEKLARAGRWRLLLQIDSDYDAAEMMWGDVGRLFWLIPDDALRRGDWDEAWMVLECS